MAINAKRFSEDEFTKMFGYLDALRESGATNMYGARPYLEKAYKLKPNDAGTALSAWMKTFSRDLDPRQRAAKAVANQAVPTPTQSE